MGEGFPAGTDGGNERAAQRFAPLNQRRALRAVDPPRPIPNRVVKHRSVNGTGGRPAGRVDPCAHPSAAWSSGSSSGS